MPNVPSPDAGRPQIFRAEQQGSQRSGHPQAGRHDRAPLSRQPQQFHRGFEAHQPNAGFSKKTLVSSGGRINEVIANVNGRVVRFPYRESSPKPASPQERVAQQSPQVRRPEAPRRVQGFNFTAHEIVRYGGREFVVENGLDPQRVALVPPGKQDIDGRTIRQFVTRDALIAAGNRPMPLNERMQKARTSQDLDVALAAFVGVQGSKDFHLSADQRRRVAHFIRTGEGEEFITKSAGVQEAALRVRGLLYNYVR